MTKANAELVIGTVQFGLAYGINGSGVAVSAKEARAILDAAWAGGVRWLDTAPGYGDVERRLTTLMGGRAFRVTSKLPALPEGIQKEDLPGWVSKSLANSLSRLGDRLARVLFHRSKDLDGPLGVALWHAAERCCRAEGLALGLSAYDDGLIARLCDRFPVCVVQMPGNAFDQRAARLTLPPRTALELRSIFLQGLLVGDPARMAKRLPAARTALGRWQAWCSAHAMDPVTAALSVARGLPGGDRLVMGVETLAQVERLIEAFCDAEPSLGPRLAVSDPAIIRPDLWKLQA